MSKLGELVFDLGRLRLTAETILLDKDLASHIESLLLISQLI